MNNSIILLRLVTMSILCLAAPPLLCRYAGSAVGALAAAGAVAFWYSQYRFPVRRERSGTYFWFVVGGYAIINLTLLVSLGRLMGFRLT